jgi:hypothetical protein
MNRMYWFLPILLLLGYPAHAGIGDKALPLLNERRPSSTTP